MRHLVRAAWVSLFIAAPLRQYALCERDKLRHGGVVLHPVGQLTDDFDVTGDVALGRVDAVKARPIAGRRPKRCQLYGEVGASDRDVYVLYRYREVLALLLRPGLRCVQQPLRWVL